MEAIGQYVLQIGSFSVLSVLLETILPSGSAKKYIRVVLGLLFMYVLIQPLLGTVTERELWPAGEWRLEEGMQQESYAQQAEQMVREAFETEVLKRGVPPELYGRYHLEKVEARERLILTVARDNKACSWTAYEPQLGSLGANEAEEDEVKQQFCSYWGVEAEQLELKIR